MTELERLLSDLVAIDSVNPSLVPGAAGEAAIGDYIASWLRQRGFDVDVEHVAPGRPNIVGTVEGRRPGPTRLLCGHTDTVGVESMSAPFTPVVRDGCLYGRGAQDMKGGLAAMLDAAARWAAGERAGAGRVIVAAVADEEYASLGAERLAARWRADEAVIPEPTGLTLGVAHKGFSCAEIAVHGRAAHGSRPDEGRDAIMAMGRVLARLDALNGELQARTPDELVGTPSVHAGTIEGGTELSVYPAHCVLHVERRTVPGEPLAIGVDELTACARAAIDRAQGFSFDVRLLLARPPYRTPPGAAVIRSLKAAVAARFGSCVEAGLSYWTDAAILGQAGTPTVLFGPRGAGLHSVEEHVRLDDVAGCRDVLQTWLSTPTSGEARAATP